MTVKKQVIVLSVVYDDTRIHGNSAAEAIARQLFDEKGIIGWNLIVKEEPMDCEEG